MGDKKPPMKGDPQKGGGGGKMPDKGGMPGKKDMGGGKGGGFPGKK